MPIFTTQFGKHPDVLYLEFGTGDIEFTMAKEIEEDRSNLLFFRQSEAHEIGETSSEHVGKLTDDVEEIRLVFKFKKAESITALIHSLEELRTEMQQEVKAELS